MAGAQPQGAAQPQGLPEAAEAARGREEERDRWAKTWLGETSTKRIDRSDEGKGQLRFLDKKRPAGERTRVGFLGRKLVVAGVPGRGFRPIPFPLPARQTGHADFLHPAFVHKVWLGLWTSPTSGITEPLPRGLFFGLGLAPVHHAVSPWSTWNRASLRENQPGRAKSSLPPRKPIIRGALQAIRHCE